MRVMLVESSGRGFLCHYAHALSLGLHEEGHQVTLITGKRDELSSWPVPFTKHACKTEGWRVWSELKRHIKKTPVDVVHIQWVDNALAVLLFIQWAHRRGIRVIYTPHNILPHRARWATMPLYRAIYRLVDRVVARDRHIAWGLEEIFDLSKLRLIFLPGSPNLMAHPAAPRRRLTELPMPVDDEFRLLYFGHGSTRKGLSFLLDVLGNRKEWPAQLHFVIAGEGVMRGVATDLLARARERLRITVIDRYVEAECVADLFMKTHLSVMPYAKLCKSPLTDLAAAFAVPLLRSDRVQGAWFQEGHHGFTLKYDDRHAWSETLYQLSTHADQLKTMQTTLMQEESVTAAIQRLAGSHTRLYKSVFENLNADVSLEILSGKALNSEG